MTAAPPRRSARIKPSSVPARRRGRIIYLGPASLPASRGLPGTRAERATPRPLFGLAPGGVCHAAPVASGPVRSYRTLSPLPVPRRAIGGLLSAALSVGSRRPGVTRHPALRSSDFPPAGEPASDPHSCAPRSPGFQLKRRRRGARKLQARAAGVKKRTNRIGCTAWTPSGFVATPASSLSGFVALRLRRSPVASRSGPESEDRYIEIDRAGRHRRIPGGENE